MGTNFYLYSDHREMKAVFGEKAELVDEPFFGYRIHIAKTSMGWLPLFEAHECIKSIDDIAALLQRGCKIYDESGIYYSWYEFEDRVLKFNGGVKGAVEPTPYPALPGDEFYDPRMPSHLPVSHFDYKYDFPELNDYFKDPHGYEFTRHEFA